MIQIIECGCYQLLKNTGFQRIVPNNETDVEDDYWKEHSKRENKE